MSKRSISITSSSASRSHNHLSSSAAIVSGKPIPGILSVSPLELRTQNATRKSTKPPFSPHTKKKPSSKAQDSLSSSTSLPAKLSVQSGTSQLKSDLKSSMTHPRRVTRGRAPSRSLSGVFLNTPPPSPVDHLSDPFISAPPTLSSTEQKALPGLDTEKAFNLSTLIPPPPTPTRRRPPKTKAKTKTERNRRSKERRKETKHSRNAMRERVTEGIPSDSAPEDMLIDMEDVPIPTIPSQGNEASSMAVAPSTPPPISVSYSFPSSAQDSDGPTPVNVLSAVRLVPSRNRNHASVPSTPPRQSAISHSISSRTLPPSHTRSSSHPFLFSASAPSSPSNHLTLGVRYANSTFQHSPSPNALPKPKFLESIFMEVDEP